MMAPAQSSSSAAVFTHWLRKVKAWFSPHWLCDQVASGLVTIVSWWDMFSRPHTGINYISFYQHTSSVSSPPSSATKSQALSPLCSVITLHLPFPARNSTHRDYISNLRVKPEKHVGFLIDHSSNSISSILLYIVPSNVTYPSCHWHHKEVSSFPPFS